MSLDCQVKGHIADNLEFTLLKLGEAAPPLATGTPYDVNKHVQHKNGKVYQDSKRVYQDGDHVPPHPIKPLPDGGVVCEIIMRPSDEPGPKPNFDIHTHSKVTLDDEKFFHGGLWSSRVTSSLLFF